MKYFTIIAVSVLLTTTVNAQGLDGEFERMDIDDDGYISAEEISVVQDQTMTQQNKETFTLLDKDGNGSINKREYTEFYSSLAAAQGGDKPDLNKNFSALDTNHDSKISAKELENFRSETKETHNQMVIEALDADKDGRISREEYDDFVKSMSEMFGAVQF